MKSLDRLREIQNKNSKIVKAVKNTNFESRKETTGNDFSIKVRFEELTKPTKPIKALEKPSNVEHYGDGSLRKC